MWEERTPRAGGAQEVPTHWDEGDLRPRVLLESADGGINWAAARALERHGYSVATCQGPDAMGRRGCPLVTEGRCKLMEDADVVVHALNPDEPQHAAVFDAARERHPSTPLVVETSRTQADRMGARLEDTTRLPYPMTRMRLLAAVAMALDTEVR